MKFHLPPKAFKTILSVALAVLMLGLGLHFLLNEGVQAAQVRDTIDQCDRRWLFIGIGLAMAYIWLHAAMYQQSFKTIGIPVSLSGMTHLYLKRNLVSAEEIAGSRNRSSDRVLNFMARPQCWSRCYAQMQPAHCNEWA